MDQTVSPDPMLESEIEESSPVMDYASHVRTFNAVMRAAKWFAIHVGILLVALYFFAIAGQPTVGVFLILVSIALLIWGMLHRSSVRDDLAKGLAAHPAARHGDMIDHDLAARDRT
jgi:hypothetical protein